MASRPLWLAVVLVCSMFGLVGCGDGPNLPIITEAPNRPPFILDGRISIRPAVIGTNVQDDCAGAVVETFRPAVEVTYDVIDLEDLCGGAFFYYSDNGGLSYKLATESQFREAGLMSPECFNSPMTSMCNPCQPPIPLGPSSAGAMAMEPDNNAAETCMNAGGGSTNRYYWDIFADGVGFPTPDQIVFCVVPTDPSNPLPAEILQDNNEILDGTSIGNQIAFGLFNRLLAQEPTNPGFFCTDTFEVLAPFTRVGIEDEDISEIRVGPDGFDFEVPLFIRNENAGGPTCFYVGIQFDNSHFEFSYFNTAPGMMGVAPTSADLVEGAPLLLAGGGAVELVSPAPATLDGTEDFFVLKVTSPNPLIGGVLANLLFRARPPVPSLPGDPPTAVISLIEIVPVGGPCEADPASCSTRPDWQLPAIDYTGITSGGSGDPCTGTRYPFIAEPPVAITCIENIPPECCIRPPVGADFRGPGLAINYFLVDREEDPVFIIPEFSTDGGMTYTRMTERVSDPLTEGTFGLATATDAACPAMPTAMDRPCDIPECAMAGDFAGAQEHFFVWDITVDIPAGSGFICDIMVRITPDDGVTTGMGCTTVIPNFFEGPDLTIRRQNDTGYQVNNIVSRAGGGMPVILPTLPDFDTIQVFATAPNGEEIDVTEAVTFVSSDPDVIDVRYDAGLGAAVIENDPNGLVAGGMRPICEIGNQCVMIDLLFNGFTMPPFDVCPIEIFDPATGMTLTELIGQIAACTDLGGPDYFGQRNVYMARGDFDAEIPGLPSGPVIPGMGGTIDVQFFVDVENQDLGAYSLDLQWESAILRFEDIFPSPVVPNLSPNTAQVFTAPIATLEWNNLTPTPGLLGVLPLETVRFIVQCPSGPCSTQFLVTVDQLVDQSLNNIGTFIGGQAESATDCTAEFTVP